MNHGIGRDKLALLAPFLATNAERTDLLPPVILESFEAGSLCQS